YPWLRAVRVKVQGGGGGGGGCQNTTSGTSAFGAGGGGGGYAEKFIPVEDLEDIETIVVGGGGLHGPTTGLGQGPGGDSRFGNHCIGYGGGAAGQSALPGNTEGTWAYEGAGGGASGGDINIPGSAGGRAIRL